MVFYGSEQFCCVLWGPERVQRPMLEFIIRTGTHFETGHGLRGWCGVMIGFLNVFVTCLNADSGKQSCKRGCSLRLARNGRSGLSLGRNVEGGCNTCVLGSYNIRLHLDMAENRIGM